MSQEDSPSYTKWTTIAASVVGALSLGLNAALGFANAGLARDKAGIEASLSKQTEELNRIKMRLDGAELDLKTTKLRNDQLDLMVKEKGVQVDLDASYAYIAGKGVFGAMGQGAKGVVQNAAWQGFQPWLGKWEAGESLLEESGGGGKRVHGVVMLRVRNRGQQEARNVAIVLRTHRFAPEGADSSPLWELDTQGWTELRLPLKDLPLGASKSIPLAHVSGTARYFGTVFMPVRLEWDNPLTSKPGSMKAPVIVAEDQWQMEGGDVHLAQ